MKLAIIQQKIFEVRGQNVMLDFDIAELYGVETKRLNEQVKRNIDRFPSDFMFRLTKKEWEFMRSQNATSSTYQNRFQVVAELRSQIATLKRTVR